MTKAICNASYMGSYARTRFCAKPAGHDGEHDWADFYREDMKRPFDHSSTGAGGGDEDGYNMTGASGPPTHRDVRNFLRALNPGHLGETITATLLRYVDQQEANEQAGHEAPLDVPFGCDPGDSAALEKLRMAIDDNLIWPDGATREAGDYEAAVRHSGALAARVVLFGKPAKPDPLHPDGRCVCGGEGRCDWCNKHCPTCGCLRGVCDSDPNSPCKAALTPVEPYTPPKPDALDVAHDLIVHFAPNEPDSEERLAEICAALCDAIRERPTTMELAEALRSQELLTFHALADRLEGK